ncbi:unnamed protein product [Porites lobata]|uniref:Autophagy-related protein 27 n=1 Tax=Porites lobata TaxID=104759 RepID=A0ABN8R762_9CNID|nr:unnamed protein product [Porites lobata]
MQMAGEGLARVRVHVLGLFIVVFTCWKFSLSYKECKKIDDCSCLTDEGEVSLKKLAETGTPRFLEIPALKAPSYKFSWNPCNPFSLGKNGSKCTKVAACLQNTILIDDYFGIATQDTATCSLGNNGECVLKYTGTGAISRKSHVAVTLRCDKSQEGTIEAPTTDISSWTVTTVLHSKYACPTSSSSHGSSGLSLGSVLVISFSCLLIVYISGGILVNVYVKHIKGKEAFPNYTFWVDLPFLVKDGCVFTFQSLGKLCGFGPSRTGYASI